MGLRQINALPAIAPSRGPQSHAAYGRTLSRALSLGRRGLLLLSVRRRILVHGLRLVSRSFVFLRLRLRFVLGLSLLGSLRRGVRSLLGRIALLVLISHLLPGLLRLFIYAGPHLPGDLRNFGSLLPGQAMAFDDLRALRPEEEEIRRLGSLGRIGILHFLLLLLLLGGGLGRGCSLDRLLDGLRRLGRCLGDGLLRTRLRAGLDAGHLRARLHSAHLRARLRARLRALTRSLRARLHRFRSRLRRQRFLLRCLLRRSGHCAVS